MKRFYEYFRKLKVEKIKKITRDPALRVPSGENQVDGSPPIVVKECFFRIDRSCLFRIDRSIDFHTFRSKLRDRSSSNHEDNFFCGAPSYDRASSKRERSRSLLLNANQALEQLRDRVLTQERAVI